MSPKAHIWVWIVDLILWASPTVFPTLPVLIGWLIYGVAAGLAIALLLNALFGSQVSGKVAVSLQIVLIAGGAAALSAGVLWYFIQPRETITTLVIRPKDYSSTIEFEEKHILPKEQPSDPFMLQIRNIGSDDVLQANLDFRINHFDAEEVISKAPALHIARRDNDGGIWIYMERTATGDTTAKIDKFGDHIVGHRNIDIIPGRGSKTVEIRLPHEVKSAIALLIIAKSSEENEKSLENMKEMPTGDLEQLFEWTEENKFRNFIAMPDIHIQLNARLSSGRPVKQSAVLRSVYLSTIPSNWVKDSRTGEVRYYLMAARGILSYENTSEPEQGFYSQWKRRIR